MDYEEGLTTGSLAHGSGVEELSSENVDSSHHDLFASAEMYAENIAQMLYLAMYLLLSLVAADTLTLKDYAAVAGLEDSPPFCEMPYRSVDISRITALCGISKGSCGECLHVCGLGGSSCLPRRDAFQLTDVESDANTFSWQTNAPRPVTI